MNNEKKLLQISRMLSLVLRHEPSKIGITLDSQGWVDTATLLHQLSVHGHLISIDDLEEIVATNSKSRFAFDADHARIRASQGHSVAVDLGYTATTPPDQLFHGTAQHNVDAILSAGIERRNRHHVHLSKDKQTAQAVGQRHGAPIILTVNAKAMTENGIPFYQSENGVWLTDFVPAQYIVYEPSKP